MYLLSVDINQLLDQDEQEIAPPKKKVIYVDSAGEEKLNLKRKRKQKARPHLLTLLFLLLALIHSSNHPPS